MSESLAALERQRSAVLSEIIDLGDFRSGSISAISGRCGKPDCRCRQLGQPAHGADRSTADESRGYDCSAKRRQQSQICRAPMAGLDLPALAAGQREPEDPILPWVCDINVSERRNCNG